MTQEALGSMILSPRLTVVGGAPGQSLENVITNPLSNGALCYVAGGSGKGEWQLDKDSEISPDGVTVVAPIAGPGRWLRLNDLNMFAGQADIWVDPVTGNDANPGTLFRPVRTLDGAKTLLNFYVKGSMSVIVHLLADPVLMAAQEVTVYSGDRFWDSIYQSGIVQWRGEQFIPLTGDLALTSNPAPTSMVYDFSALTPGWTPGQWVGHTVECVQSATIPIGQKRFILYNTADQLFMSWVHTSYPAETNPSPGDLFRIGTAAVGISVQPGADHKLRSLKGGESGSSVHASFTRPPSGYLGFRNLELYFPDDPSGISRGFVLSGRLDFTGCCVSQSDTAQCRMNVENATMSIGQYVLPQFQDADGEYVYGWGLAFRSRTQQDEPGILTMFSSLGYSYFAGGAATFRSTVGEIGSHSFSAGESSSALNSAIYGLSCEIYINTHSLFRTAATDQKDIFVDCPGSYISSDDHRHLGVGAVFQARYQSTIDFFTPFALYLGGTTPLIASGLESNAQQSSNVRLNADVGVAFGDVSIGRTTGVLTKTTRAAAAWGAGVVITNALGDWVGRT